MFLVKLKKLKANHNPVVQTHSTCQLRPIRKTIKSISEPQPTNRHPISIYLPNLKDTTKHSIKHIDRALVPYLVVAFQ